MNGENLPRPWLAHYGNMPESVVRLRPPTPLAAFAAAVARAADSPAIRYFDSTISYGELSNLAEGFRQWLNHAGVVAGDHVMIVTNNIPHFMVALVGIWKARAIPVPVNPMYRAAELARLMADCRPRAIVSQYDNLVDVRDGMARAGLAASLIASDPYDFQSEDDAGLLPARNPRPQGVPDLLEESERLGRSGSAQKFPELDPTETGLILYTSGTTGAAKGAMLPHSALAQSGYAARPWVALGDGAIQLAIAPLFHITGLVNGCCSNFDGACSVILTYRFNPASLLSTIERHKPNFVVAASTAFIGLLSNPAVDRDSMSSLHSVFSGGAAVPPALVKEFAERTGLTIHPAFGMTETAAGAIITPHGTKAPFDAETGALSIGIPMSDVDAIIVDDEGNVVQTGTAGELLIRGPGLMSGYLNKPEETAAALRDGWMHSGDVAFMDAEGWFYIVDRKKDLINASGYKVWPREVEDALYEHPAIREAAVIGVADDYRGETVKAVVSLKPGAGLDDDQLKAHCRERLAPYKIPRIIEIVADLPKTETGKISRAILRAAPTPVANT